MACGRAGFPMWALFWGVRGWNHSPDMAARACCPQDISESEPNSSTLQGCTVPGPGPDHSECLQVGQGWDDPSPGLTVAAEALLTMCAWQETQHPGSWGSTLYLGPVGGRTHAFCLGQNPGELCGQVICFECPLWNGKA